MLSNIKGYVTRLVFFFFGLFLLKVLLASHFKERRGCYYLNFTLRSRLLPAVIPPLFFFNGKTQTMKNTVREQKNGRGETAYKHTNRHANKRVATRRKSLYLPSLSFYCSAPAITAAIKHNCSVFFTISFTLTYPSLSLCAVIKALSVSVLYFSVLFNLLILHAPTTQFRVVISRLNSSPSCNCCCPSYLSTFTEGVPL